MTEGNRNDPRKRCYGDSLSTINPTMSSFRLDLGLCVEKSATKCPKQCAVMLGVSGTLPVHTDVHTHTHTHTHTHKSYRHTSVVHPTQDVATSHQVTTYIYMWK